MLWISFQELLLLHPIDFVWLCFHCHLSQGILKFPLWFHHWPIGFLAVCCLVSMSSFSSHFFFCGLFLVSYCLMLLWSEKMTKVIYTLSNLLKLALCLGMWYEDVPQMQCTWTWANSGRWWGTGRPGVLQSMGCEELDRTWQLGNNNMRIFHVHLKSMCILGFVTVMSWNHQLA